MDQLERFNPLGEVTADERSRIAFGKAGVRRDDRYAVSVGDDGSILLTPLVTIPKRELLVWENEQVRTSLARALAQSAAGETVDLGDFTHYSDRPDDGVLGSRALQAPVHRRGRRRPAGPTRARPPREEAQEGSEASGSPAA